MTERTSYLSEDEVAAAQVLPDNAPYAICHVSTGIFSVFRHYARMSFQGYPYTYMPEHDECIRDDVLALVRKLRREDKKATPSAVQMTIEGDDQ